MIGGDAVAYEAGRAAGAQVNQYTLTSQSAAGVVAVPSAQSNIADALVTVAPDDTVTVTWTRPLAAGAYTGARAVPASGSTTVIWASGSPPYRQARRQRRGSRDDRLCLGRTVYGRVG